MLLILMAFSLDCVSVILLPLLPLCPSHIEIPIDAKLWLSINFSPAITCILVDTSFVAVKDFFVFQ